MNCATFLETETFARESCQFDNMSLRNGAGLFAGLDQNLTGVLAQLSKNKCIKRLAIGKNMNSIRPK